MYRPVKSSNFPSVRPERNCDVDDSARVTRERVRETDAAGIVVEHDLASLDLLANGTHVLYGDSGGFGIVSGCLSTRTGINQFLSSVGVTVRRDDRTDRPRVNDPGSRLDRERTATGDHHYVDGP